MTKLLLIIGAIMFGSGYWLWVDAEGKSKQINDLERIKQIIIPLEEFKRRTGKYPNDLSELGMRSDGWGRPYSFTTDGKSYEIRGLGRDGEVTPCPEPRSICGKLDLDTVNRWGEFHCYCSK